MSAYETLKENISKGWQSWDNASVLSHIWMPEGMGIRLGFKDYTKRQLLKKVLIGDEEEEKRIIPIAHSYKGDFTEIKVIWFDNSITVKTAVQDNDLVILLVPEKIPQVYTTLIVEGISLWNNGGIIRKLSDSLVLETDSVHIPVYISEHVQKGVYFTECDTPYLAVELKRTVAISTGCHRSVQEIHKIIEKAEKKWEKNQEKYGALKDAYNAMQTCQAWDTIYNPQNRVPITTVSRIWNKSWGGYVMFCWDTYFAALMQSLDNKDLCYCNLIEITHTVTEKGFVPNFTTQDFVKSFDRSQPPVGSMVALLIYNKYREKWILQEIYQDLLSWNEWYIQNRSTKNGLLAWGSTPYESRTGDFFETHAVNERQGAAYESGLDNSPMYDDIPFDQERHILLLEDVGLVGLYIKDCYSLSEIAGILGQTDTSRKLLDRARDMENNMEQLWDEKTGMYLNRREDTGEFEYRLSPFHFHALFSKKVGKKRAERIIQEHILNEKEFWGEYIIPSIARNDKAYSEPFYWSGRMWKPMSYWRGRIWGPMNFLTYMAIKEYGFRDVCKQFAEKSVKLLLKEWLRDGHVHENYDSQNGEGCNSDRSDKFYHWGGLLAFIGLFEEGYYL